MVLCTPIAVKRKDNAPSNESRTCNQLATWNSRSLRDSDYETIPFELSARLKFFENCFVHSKVKLYGRCKRNLAEVRSSQETGFELDLERSVQILLKEKR